MHWEWSLGLEMWGDFKYIFLKEVKFLMLLLLHSKTVPSDPQIFLRGVAEKRHLSPISLFLPITFCLCIITEGDLFWSDHNREPLTTAQPAYDNWVHGKHLHVSGWGHPLQAPSPSDWVVVGTLFAGAPRGRRASKAQEGPTQTFWSRVPTWSGSPQLTWQINYFCSNVFLMTFFQRKPT